MARVDIDRQGKAVIVCDRCIWCRQQARIPLNTEELRAWNQWRSGTASIQVAFHMWPAGKRELLISGTHDECWEKYMKGPED